MVCFVHFHLEMCFAPQRRALFQHLNFQKWSENGVFCTFWLQNVLRATTACTFSTSQLPKVVRRWGVLYILTWKCASRHNGVQFFISHLASWLRTRRFSEPTFRPSGAPNHWKNTVSRLSYLFAHLHLLSSDLFSSDSFHLCFSTVHIVGSFTSKLPSITRTFFCPPSTFFWSINLRKDFNLLSIDFNLLSIDFNLLLINLITFNLLLIYFQFTFNLLSIDFNLLLIYCQLISIYFQFTFNLYTFNLLSIYFQLISIYF